MIWNDKRIIQWAEKGGITPYNPKRVNPASIDLCLGEYVRYPTRDGWSPPYKIHPRVGLCIEAGEFVLLHSMETTKIPDDAIALLFLKSSTGRKGLEHLHAGYGDSSFNGQWTFEIINHWPFPQFIYVSQPLFQLVLCDTEKALTPYTLTGHYQNQTGATIPWEWKNIKG
jgi:deoxycytidine triphosphate deaminase